MASDKDISVNSSDARREEDVLLNVAKNPGNTMVGVNVDVSEILHFALDDITRVSTSI